MIYRWPKAEVCLIWIVSGLICFGQILADDGKAAVSVLFGRIGITSTDNSSLDLTAINDSFGGEIVTEKTYRDLTEKILNIVLREGYLYPVLSLTAITPESDSVAIRLNPDFRLERGKRVVIDTVIYEGAERTSPELLAREARSITGQIPYSKNMAAFSANFRDYPFIKIKAVPEIIATREGGYGLLVKVTEQSANNFSGVVGYVPPTTITSGYVTGEVTIKLNNISGRGRRLNVYWAKPERNSQEIELSYYEPWIANSNYSFRGKFSQVLRDTLLVAREFEAGIGRRAFRKGSVALNFNYTATMPTVSGRELLRLTDVSTGGIGLNASFDSRDNQINPRRGIQANGSAYLSRRSEDGQGLWQYRVGFNGEVALPLKPQLIAACFWNYEGKWLSAGAPVYGDYYWFGGARSLRGYADDLFGGSEVAWLNSELRWLIGRNGRMHLFFDQGYYRLPAKGADRRVCPHSYGVGLRLDSRMGIIGLDYGFGEGDTFSTAKIHVFLETNF